MLLTGGAGFIGSHVAEALLAAGHQVRILDDLSTGKRSNVPSGCELLVGSIADPAAVARAVAGVSGIIHLAAIASVPRSVADPVGTNAANLVGTIQLLHAARAAGVERMIYASSASIYGSAAGERNGEPFPITETTVAAPQTPYAVDKHAGELYAQFFHREHGLHASAFRFFNIFGERQDPSSPYSGVISIFVDRLVRNEEITIEGDGRQTRDFVYVKDVANILVHEYEQSVRPETMPVYNIGSGLSTSLLDIVSALQAISGRTPTMRFAAPRVGDIRHSLADSRRLQNAFPEHVFTPFATGLTRLWEHSLHPAEQ